MTISDLHWLVIAFMTVGWIPGGRHWQYVRSCHALAWVVAMSHWLAHGRCPLSPADAVGSFSGIPEPLLWVAGVMALGANLHHTDLRWVTK